MTRLYILASAAVLALTAAPALAQTPAAPAAAATPLPRTADGHPDLSGAWNVGPGGALAFLKPVKDDKGNVCIVACNLKDGDPAAAFELKKDGTRAAVPQMGSKDFPKYKPEYLAKVAQLEKDQVLNDPVLKCMNPGVPRIGHPHKIIQTPDQVTLLYGDWNGSFWRLIPTNGQGHRPDLDPSLMGDSVGRWEGDTLVIETVNFSDISWLTDDGAFHTSEMKVVERLTPTPQGLRYEMTVHDPEVLAEPWVRRPRMLTRQVEEPAHQVPCIEQSIQHIADFRFHHDNPR
jgi:hypothetical protein